MTNDARRIDHGCEITKRNYLGDEIKWGNEMKDKLPNLPTIIVLISVCLTIVGIIVVWTSEPAVQHAKAEIDQNARHSVIPQRGLVVKQVPSNRFWVFRGNVALENTTGLKNVDQPMEGSITGIKVTSRGQEMFIPGAFVSSVEEACRQITAVSCDANNTKLKAMTNYMRQDSTPGDYYRAFTTLEDFNHKFAVVRR